MIVWCPNTPNTVLTEPDDTDVMGCGGEFEVPNDWRDRPEFDDMIDCPFCGICFNPDHPNNRRPVDA